MFGVVGDRIGHRDLLAMMRATYAVLAATLLAVAGAPRTGVAAAADLPLATLASPPLTLHVPQLDATQIAGYVQHRLTAAGSGGRAIFEPETFGEILRYTGGTPLLVNTLCDAAMVLAGGVVLVWYFAIRPSADAQGYVTQSNVNPVEEMVNMISASRSYQNNIEVMNTAKTLLLKTLQLGQ